MFLCTDPNEVVAQMLALAKVKGDDVLYDLGSGDGRIVITAAQSSVRVASVWTLTRNALRMPMKMHKGWSN